jgi:hypothetical protein
MSTTVIFLLINLFKIKDNPLNNIKFKFTLHTFQLMEYITSEVAKKHTYF